MSWTRLSTALGPGSEGVAEQMAVLIFWALRTRRHRPTESFRVKILELGVVGSLRSYIIRFPCETLLLAEHFAGSQHGAAVSGKRDGFLLLLSPHPTPVNCVGRGGGGFLCSGAVTCTVECSLASLTSAQ